LPLGARGGRPRRAPILPSCTRPSPQSTAPRHGSSWSGHTRATTPAQMAEADLRIVQELTLPSPAWPPPSSNPCQRSPIPCGARPSPPGPTPRHQPLSFEPDGVDSSNPADRLTRRGGRTPHRSPSAGTLLPTAGFLPTITDHRAGGQHFFARPAPLACTGCSWCASRPGGPATPLTAAHRPGIHHRRGSRA